MRSYFIAIFTSYVLASACAYASDSDNDKVFDQYDVSPLLKVKSFAKNTVSVSQLSGIFNGVSVPGLYRFGDEIAITGNQFNVLTNPIIVVYQHNNIFNFLPATKSNDGLSFKLDVPKGKYSLFLYDNDQKTNELKVEPFALDAPLIFGDSAVSLEKGKAFTLSGIGFNQDSKVVLGALKISPKSVTNTRLVFEVPNNAAGLQFYIENNSLRSNIIRVTHY